ncbi:MAG: hypothetical protein IJZ77_02705 [Bacilli bacterium]|nr:hypothetical protein [Bacilli bacterium]
MAVYNIKIVSSDGTSSSQPIGSSSEYVLIQNEGTTTLTTKLASIASSLSSLNSGLAGKASTAVATTAANGLMSSTDKAKLDGIAAGANAYSLPTASASTLGGVKIGTGIDISAGVISNAGVRSIASGSTAGTISVNTNGTSANVKVNGWDSIAWVASYTANSFAPADYKPAAASVKVGALAANMTVTNSATLTGMLRNIEYTPTDPGAGVANTNNGLMICVYE